MRTVHDLDQYEMDIWKAVFEEDREFEKFVIWACDNCKVTPEIIDALNGIGDGLMALLPCAIQYWEEKR